MRKKNGVLAFILFVILTFMAFRQFLIGDEILSGYTGEIAAAFLGGVITIIITALLLHKQTEVEMSKERNVRILDEKISTYNELIAIITSVLEEAKMTRGDKLKLQLVSQKLVQIASNEVLEAFSNFSRAIQGACKGDDEIDDKEIEEVLLGLQEVSLQIRLDITSHEERDNLKKSIPATREISKQFIKAFKLENTRGIEERCTEEENGYFLKLRELVDQSDELSSHSGKVGFSIKKADIPILWCYPITPSTQNNLIFHKNNLDDESLEFLRLKHSDLTKKRIPLNISDVQLEELIDFLTKVKIPRDRG